MKLRELIKNTALAPVKEDQGNLEVPSVTADSRKVTAGGLFVALAGPKTHGAKFIEDAMARGAQIIVTGMTGISSPIPDGILYLKTEDPQAFLAQALSNFYHDPSGSIRLIGITGTNGKTTITYLLETMLAAAGKTSGVIGTINHRYGKKILKADNTTPGLVDNVRILAEMVAEKIDYCAMEVSSHALDQRRVEGLDFQYAIFTNLTSDHLDYHKDRETYFGAKAKLFTGLAKNRRAIINIDDEFGPRLKDMTAAPVWTYAIKKPADFSARRIELGFTGTCFELVTPLGTIEIMTPLIGLHNIYNILSVAAVGVGEEIPLCLIKKGVEALSQVPGRLERIEAGQDFYVFVDYAHTEDAMRNVLSSLRAVKKSRLTVVFGCGGDRDKTKRARMANVVEELSDFAIVTTDNPRSEDPQQIVQNIIGGFRKQDFKVILDRGEAIMEALRVTQKGDVVLIAGKGHENYQIFKDKTIDFDERKIVLQSLMTLGKS